MQLTVAGKIDRQGFIFSRTRVRVSRHNAVLICRCGKSRIAKLGTMSRTMADVALFEAQHDCTAWEEA